MESRKLPIPGGMQDTLPGECRRKRRLEQSLRELFARGGYREIETPILEYLDALDDETVGLPAEHVWKTFDRRGRVLAIRPDTTIPAVRLAAGKLREETLPLRLCYVQSATAYESDTLSLLCEQTQAGVELMGPGGAAADAEVIALAAQALQDAGLRSFQIELGQAMFFEGFMQEAGLEPEEVATVRALTEQKNSLAMQLYLEKLSVSRQVAARLERLPLLYGGPEVLEEAERLTEHPLCRQALANLREVMALLGVYGCGDCLTVDLGMVQQANYYSGITFRGMTASLGQPLLSGGRYDRLPEAFGRKMPATGFAVSLKLLLMALERQGESFAPPVPDLMVGYAEGALRQAVGLAREARAKGLSACVQYGASAEDVKAMIRRGEAARGAFVSAEGTVYWDRVPGEGAK